MRRKGEQRVAVLRTEDLFKLLDCNDIDVLIAKTGRAQCSRVRQRLR